MAKVSMLNAQCPHCHSAIKVSAALSGKTIACPKCQRNFSLPVLEDVPAPAASAGGGADAAVQAEKAKDLRPVVCSSCGARLMVHKAKVDRMGVCPRCEMNVRFDNALSTEQEFGLSQTDGNLLGKEVFLAQGEDVRSFKVMRELEEQGKDKFGKALLKSVLYPFNQLGAIIFFVIGIPVAIMLVQLIGNSILSRAAGEGAKGAATVYAVSAGTLLVPLALASFFCSFLLGVVRVTAQGRSSTPVVQGMAHRANLAAMCAWMALYFGLALFAGYRAGAAHGEAFRLSVPAVVLFALGALAAPMGLLCTATVSVSGGLHLPRVLSAIGQAAKPYFACLGTILLSAAFYGLLVLLCWRVADGAAAAWLRYGARFLAYLMMPMPLVSMARAVGLFAQYHAKALPFDMDFFADSKAGALPNLVALAGALFLFLPIHGAQAHYVDRIGLAHKCLAQMTALHETLVGSRDYAESVSDLPSLAGRLGPNGADRLTCPLTAEELADNPNRDALREPPFYVVVPQPSGRHANANWIMMYEKASVYPDGRKVNVMLRGKLVHPRPFRLEDAQKLAEILSRLVHITNYEGEEYRRTNQEYESAFGAANALAIAN